MRKIIKFIPNGITASRIIMSILFVLSILYNFKYRQQRIFELMFIFLCICISDIIDGYTARKINSTSAAGAKFDVFADLIFISSSYITLIILDILPMWFLIFIGLKFIEFLFTSNFMRKRDCLSINPFVFDRWGKITAVMFFIIPGAACIFNILSYCNLSYLMNFILYGTLISGLFSSYLRIRRCIS